MTLPVQFKNRKALNPRLGIKSSFSGIRNAVALLYLIFNAERLGYNIKAPASVKDGVFHGEDELLRSLSTKEGGAK